MSNEATSRRTVLRGAAVLGATAAGGALGSRPEQARAAASNPHLVLSYRPSQPTGWGEGFTPSVGGHTAAKDFTFQGTSYRISLSPANPRYEEAPRDTTVGFRRVLANTFGEHYSFRYQNGFTGRDEFSVESCNVYTRQAGPGIIYGADLYVVYRPGRGDPGVHDNLNWIQVINWPQGPFPVSTVDNDLRANPFYIAGGLTSINGDQVVTFSDQPQTGVQGVQHMTLADRFTAEVFLTQDTGTKDANGRDIVLVFGGIKYGWRVQQA